MERLPHYRFGIVLVLILASLAFQLAAPDDDVARLVTVALQGATLIAAAVASQLGPWAVRVALGVSAALIAGSLGAVLGTEGFGADSTRLAAFLLVALAPPAIVIGLLRQFRAEGAITLHTMFGVLCIYLLLGMLFATAYGSIAQLSGEPFFVSGEETTADFLYFSFVTLTTVGYGDLVAATGLGRSLAITEALLGQIYLVTVVAIIVANIGRAPARRRA